MAIVEPTLTEYTPYTLRSAKGAPLTHDEMDANFKEITFLSMVNQMIAPNDIFSLMSKINNPILLTENMSETYTGKQNIDLVFKVPSGYSHAIITRNGEFSGGGGTSFYKLDRENVKCSNIDGVSNFDGVVTIIYTDNNEEESYFMVISYSLKTEASSITVEAFPSQYIPSV